MSDELKLISEIENMIYVIRGQRVMLDSDLARLYGVETKRLNEQVKRNHLRFPNDFMFQINSEEYDVLKSQIATSKSGRGGKQKKPLVFTENGIAMLSSVLHSESAILVNIAIMRIFTKLRSYLLLENDLRHRMDKLESNSSHLFKIVFERLDDMEERLTPILPKTRKRIGLK